jgi:hypothetical protein
MHVYRVLRSKPPASQSRQVTSGVHGGLLPHLR